MWGCRHLRLSSVQLYDLGQVLPHSRPDMAYLDKEDFMAAEILSSSRILWV